jgi:putative ABC transport system substrate-binding protein
MRRIGVLLGLSANDREGQARIGAFLQALQQLGWTDGRDVQILRRFTDSDADRARAYAAELAALAPDVILTSGASTAGIMLQATRTVPVVFVGAADPVGAGHPRACCSPQAEAAVQEPSPSVDRDDTTLAHERLKKKHKKARPRRPGALVD